MASSDEPKNKKTVEEDLRDINADLEDVKEPVPEALDLLDRDPTEMNEFVKVSDDPGVMMANQSIYYLLYFKQLDLKPIKMFPQGLFDL